MLLLVKNLVMLIVAMVAFSTFTGCGTGTNSIPKPSVDACMVITKDNAAFCINNLSGHEYDITLEELNKFTCFSPDHYGTLLIYIKLLQRYTGRRIDKKLRAFEYMDYKHQRRLDGFTSNQ